MAKKTETETKEAANQQETSEVSQPTNDVVENAASNENVSSEEDDGEDLTDSTKTVEEDESLGEEGVDADTSTIEAETKKAETKENDVPADTSAKTVVKTAPQYRPEKDGAVTKFFKFEASQGRSFDLDKGFIRIVAYKRLRIRFVVMNSDYDFDYESICKHVSDMAYKVIGGMRVDDIEINTIPEKKVYLLNKIYNVVDIMVPYMRSSGKVVNGYKSLIEHLNAETKDVQYKLKIESAISILVDTKKEEKNVSVKGFNALSFIDYSNKNNEEKEDPKVFLKGTTFIDKHIGFDTKDLINANDVLSVNKLKIYDLADSDEYSNLKYVLPFRSKFALVTYQWIGMTGKNKFKISRTLNRVRIRNIHIANVTIPIGVYVTSRRDTISVNGFEKFFVDTEYKEMKNANALETYSDLPFGTFEMDRFKDDCKLIDQILFDQLAYADDNTNVVETTAAAPETTTETPESVQK
jgi:hypothetical protein